MKCIVDVDGFIILEHDALKGAEEAFGDTRYVEAFALLHAYIDWWMTSNIQLRVKDPFERKYRFIDSAKCLRCNKTITDAEYQRLLRFNKLRNVIIHRKIRYSYQHFQITGERSTITLPEVIEGFKEGIDLAKSLKEKTSPKFWNPKLWDAMFRSYQKEKPNENP